MGNTADSFQWAEDIEAAVTVSDKEGVVVYMNKRSRETFNKNGESMVGRSMLPCHNERSKEIINEMLTKARNEYDTLRTVVMHNGTNDIEDTTPSLKTVEDDGAYQLSKEEASQLAQRQYKFIQNLEAALVRIENKTYGVCRVTGKLIPKERLRLVPHATLTVEAKEMLAKKGRN